MTFVIRYEVAYTWPGMGGYWFGLVQRRSMHRAPSLAGRSNVVFCCTFRANIATRACCPRLSLLLVNAKCQLLYASSEPDGNLVFKAAGNEQFLTWDIGASERSRKTKLNEIR